MCLLYFSDSFHSHHKAGLMMEDTGKNAVWKMTLPVMFCMSRAFLRCLLPDMTTVRGHEQPPAISFLFIEISPLF